MPELEPSLDIDKLLANPHAQVEIHHNLKGGGGPWRSWVPGEFSVDTSTEFSAPFEDLAEATSKLIGQLNVATGGEFSEQTEKLGLRLDSARSRANLVYT